MARPAPALPSKVNPPRSGQAGAAPPSAMGASAAFATKPATKVGGPPPAAIAGPPSRAGAKPLPSPQAAPQAAVKAAAPVPMPTPAPQAPTADATDEIDIELDYDASPRPNNNAIEIDDGGLADAETALEAMQSFRLAEAALQRNDFANAQELAQKAVDGDPTQSDYITLLAWIRALGNNPAVIEEAIHTMTRVLADDLVNERALLYRGRLFARTNRFHEALADFNELLASNPQNREAANEARQIKAKLG